MALGNQYIHKFFTKVLDKVMCIVVFLNNFCHFKTKNWNFFEYISSENSANFASFLKKSPNFQ
jgi:hypothetical protein